MEEVNRREALKLASAGGVAALAASLALAADKEGVDTAKEKKARLKVLGVGESKIACGSTVAGEGWQPYDPEGKGPGKHIGVYIDVDTGEARFKSAPVYITSVAADDTHGHWEVTGASAVYPRLDKDGNPLPLQGGFRLYLKSPSAPDQVAVLDAAKKAWYVNWVAVGE
jgi:hypothetical protein